MNVLVSAFVETMLRVGAASGGLVPEKWCTLSRSQLQNIAMLFDPREYGILNWQEVMMEIWRLGLPKMAPSGALLLLPAAPWTILSLRVRRSHVGRR